MAPFFSRSDQGSGNVFYEQSLNNPDLFEAISEDISTYEMGTDSLRFVPTFALKVTWNNVSSVNDSEQV